MLAKVDATGAQNVDVLLLVDGVERSTGGDGGTASVDLEGTDGSDDDDDVLPRHRYLPLTCDELDGRDGAPVELSRGFFAALTRSDEPARGALSFMTILAWISSSLDAFTFFGQKSVTNLDPIGMKKVSDASWKEKYIATHVHR